MDSVVQYDLHVDSPVEILMFTPVELVTVVGLGISFEVSRTDEADAGSYLLYQDHVRPSRTQVEDSCVDKTLRGAIRMSHDGSQSYKVICSQFF
jgi:hypothetical protein